MAVALRCAMEQPHPRGLQPPKSASIRGIISLPSAAQNQTSEAEHESKLSCTMTPHALDAVQQGEPYNNSHAAPGSGHSCSTREGWSEGSALTLGATGPRKPSSPEPMASTADS